jgi:hypothetical protein
VGGPSVRTGRPDDHVNVWVDELEAPRDDRRVCRLDVPAESVSLVGLHLLGVTGTAGETAYLARTLPPAISAHVGRATVLTVTVLAIISGSLPPSLLLRRAVVRADLGGLQMGCEIFSSSAFQRFTTAQWAFWIWHPRAGTLLCTSPGVPVKCGGWAISMLAPVRDGQRCYAVAALPTGLHRPGFWKSATAIKRALYILFDAIL